MYIYALYDPFAPEQLRYVGYTINTPEQRLRAHIEEATSKGGKSPTYKNRWIRKLLSEGRNPLYVVLEATADPDEAERRWIKKCREMGHKLTNGTDGGKGCLGARWKLTPKQIEALKSRPIKPVTPEERERLRGLAVGNKNRVGKKLTAEHRACLMAKTHSPEAKAKRQVTWERKRLERETRRALEPKKQPGMTGKKHSEETKRQWSEKRTGMKRNPEVSAKAAESNRGRKRTPEQCARVSEGLRRAWARKREVNGMA